MIRRDLLTGHWRPYLERAMTLNPCYEGGINGGEVAARILQDTAYGKNYTLDKVELYSLKKLFLILSILIKNYP